MKVLLSAFSCCPGRGSEPGVGWNWADQISRRHEVWLLTSDEYEPQMRQVNRPNLHVHFVPSFRRFSRFQRSGIPGLGWMYYYWWQWKAYRLARQLHAQVEFDLAHHATFVTWRAPSFLSLLPIPLIWGPVGGGENSPASLRAEFGAKGRAFEFFRDICQRLSRFDPFVRLTMRHAALILAANRETADVIAPVWRSKVRIMPAIGMSASEEEPPAKPPRDDRPGFLILVVGMLEPRKGGALALKAFQTALFGRLSARLVFIGQGPDRSKLTTLAAALGISDHVEFLGSVPREQVFGWMQAADALLFPSMRDSGGLAPLEAMLLGKPVVCLDVGGPGQVVTDDCGIKVRPGTPNQVASDLAAALQRLAADPELRRKMGEAGRQRVLDEFDWDKKGQTMLGMYLEVKSAKQVPDKHAGCG